MSPRFGVFCAASLLSLASCAKDLTEIVLVVDTDYAVPAEVDTVAVTVDGPAGSHALASAPLAGPGSVSLPLSLGMSPAGSATSVVVTAVGSHGGREVVRRFARANFVDGQRRMLYITLLRSCGGVTCPAGESCGETGCTDGVTATLPTWSGTLPARLDASAPADAPGMDVLPSDVTPDQGPPAMDAPPDVASDATDAARMDVLDASDAVGDDVTDAPDARDTPEVFDAADARADATDATDAADAADGAEAGACPAMRADCDRSAANGCEVDTATDVLHCGACGRACAGRANSVAVCMAGACMTVCAPGFGDCNTMASDGCEASLRTTANCGTCGSTCAPRANATVACATGTCTYACATGFGDCDGDVANGCEADLRTSTASCGACGRTCRPANAVGRCAAGVCSFTCNDGFADCDMSAANGCEANLHAPASCGSCTAACPAPRANMVATCATGVCDATCATGFGDCDSDLANGCEINLSTATRNCGVCGTVCPTNPSATAGCASGRCINRCVGLTGDCDGVLSNGCERNVSSDASNCGACARECAVAHAVPGCAAGVCVPETCDTGWGDCDTLPATGCETSLTTTTNCGTCGNACSTGLRCVSGRCV